MQDVGYSFLFVIIIVINIEEEENTIIIFYVNTSVVYVFYNIIY